MKCSICDRKVDKVRDTGLCIRCEFREIKESLCDYCNLSIVCQIRNKVGIEAMVCAWFEFDTQKE